MKSQTMKRSFVFFLVLAVCMTMSFAVSTGDVNAAAKTKKITLKASATKVVKGETVKITVSKVTPKAASKAVTWKVVKGAKCVKVTKKTKTSITLKALKPGTVKVKATAKNGKATKTISFKINKTEKLKCWGITGYYKSGVDTINKVKLDKKLTVKVWDKSTKKFKTGKKSNINGQYTALYDTDGNKKADLVKVVKFKDGPKYWDAKATWINGIGKNTIPNEISDKVGKKMFSAEYRIPMGERLLSEYGLGPYSGTTDWANLKDGGYWENNYANFYNVGSTDTLTMLTGYKTDLQPTGSLCVLSSTNSVLEWYGQRHDLNEIDLALLRGNDMNEKTGTSLDRSIQVFKKLGSLGLTCEWAWDSYKDHNGEMMEADWVQEQLSKGHPIIVSSNSFGAHGQVIIGYDTMGTDDTLDDVCIMMDPYDTTDQNNDGYIIQPFERMQYNLFTWYDEEGNEVTTGTQYIAVWPKDASLWDNKYKPVKGTGLPEDPNNKGNFTKEMELDYGNSAADIQSFYPDTPDVSPINGLAGAATGGYEYSGNHDLSCYFTENDYYNATSAGEKNTLHILPKFKTIQQTTEWTCGCASALMNLEWFDMNKVRTADTDPGKGFKETDVSLATHRQGGKAGATSKAGMREIFDYMHTQYGENWTIFTNDELIDAEGNSDPLGEYEEDYIGGYCLQAGDAYPEEWPGLIPYLIDNGIPMMIGSDEWGGHWQVIIGYDGMGTEGTQDDVLILADPYDTTDHNQDGYVVKGFERLVYGWGSAFEKGFEGTKACDFIVAFPTEGYEHVIKDLGLN